MLQIRPGPGRHPRLRDPMYAPHRDIAYIGPQLLVVAASEVLSPQNWPPWYRELMSHYGVSMETLNDAAMKLMEAFGDVSSLRYSFDEALRRSGFTYLPAAVQGLFYMKMGKFLLAAMHRGLGDIMDYDGDIAPHVQDMVNDIVNMAKKLPNV